MSVMSWKDLLHISCTENLLSPKCKFKTVSLCQCTLPSQRSWRSLDLACTMTFCFFLILPLVHPQNKLSPAFAFRYQYKTFRYLTICHSAIVLGRETLVGNQIRNMLLSSSLCIGLISLLYLDKIRIYLRCLGREEIFEMNLSSVFEEEEGGMGTRLPFSNPYRLSTNIASCLFILVVPLLYHKIFIFRQNQDFSIRGKYQTPIGTLSWLGKFNSLWSGKCFVLFENLYYFEKIIFFSQSVSLTQYMVRRN